MINLFRPFMAPEAKQRLADLLTYSASGGMYLGQGPAVEEFEIGLRELLSAPRDVLTTNSCTSAIDLALHLIGVGPRSLPPALVISTPMTCTASNSPIVTRGARIAWADVDPVTGCIDPISVARLVERYQREPFLGPAKAIIAVDWAGAACDYAALRQCGLPVIEDAAHALLTGVRRWVDVTCFASDQRVYVHGEVAPIARAGGDYVCWSFQAIKHLTCGDGGALLCPDDATTERARLLRWYGLDRRSSKSFRCEQSIEEAGFKAHMNDVAASIGLANLPHARRIVEQHRANARFYHRELANLDGVDLPPPDPGSSWWLYPLRVDNRDRFIVHMATHGVECSPVHARNDTHPAFRAACVNPDDPLPGVDSYSSREVAIPVHWAVTEEDRECVVEAVSAWSRKGARVTA